MKTTKTQFNEFIKWCEIYRNRFGLLDWNVYYRREYLKESYATIDIDLTEKTSTIKFNTILDKSDIENSWIHRTAKHEMIHLLVGRLAEIANARYVTSSELDEAIEGLVHSLEALIK